MRVYAATTFLDGSRRYEAGRVYDAAHTHEAEGVILVAVEPIVSRAEVKIYLSKVLEGVEDVHRRAELQEEVDAW